MVMLQIQVMINQYFSEQLEKIKETRLKFTQGSLTRSES